MNPYNVPFKTVILKKSGVLIILNSKTRIKATIGKNSWKPVIFLSVFFISFTSGDCSHNMILSHFLFAEFSDLFSVS